MSQAGELNIAAGTVPGDVPIDFVTDSGTATSVNNIINVLGGTNVTTSGSGNTLTITSTPPNPAGFFEFYDEFGEDVTQVRFSSVFVTPENGHPGIRSNNNNLNTFGMIYRKMDVPDALHEAQVIDLPSGETTTTIIGKMFFLSNGVTRYTLQAGLTAFSLADSVFTDGVYIEYSDTLNSGNWTLTSMASSVSTQTDSGVAATTGWHNFYITTPSDGSSASYYVDGVLLGTNNTNMPTALMTPTFKVTVSVGSFTQAYIYYDMIYVTQKFNTSR